MILSLLPPLLSRSIYNKKTVSWTTYSDERKQLQKIDPAKRIDLYIPLITCRFRPELKNASDCRNN